MFFSEPLQCQYVRRQVTGHMTVPTYRRAMQLTEKVHYQVHTVSLYALGSVVDNVRHKNQNTCSMSKIPDRK
jgi:hypothetical protein